MITSAPVHASEFTDDVRKIYADMAEDLSAREIDIPAVLEFTKKYYADDVTINTSVMDTRSGEVFETIRTKEGLLEDIPQNYSYASDSEAEFIISDLMLKGGPWHAIVQYEIKYKADLNLEDRIGRHFVQTMHLYSKCEDELYRSALGHPQITASDCTGAAHYTDPKYVSWHDE